MKRINLFIHSCLILLTVSGVLLATPGSVQAQTMPPGPDDNLSRWQLASFDSFLDSHPEVAEQVRQNPSLVNNEDFVEAHPALQQYLQQHPEIREQISQNPNGVMRQEQRFDRRATHGSGRPCPHTEPVELDPLMDRHPPSAEQLLQNSTPV